MAYDQGAICNRTLLIFKQVLREVLHVISVLLSPVAESLDVVTCNTCNRTFYEKTCVILGIYTVTVLHERDKAVTEGLWGSVTECYTVTGVVVYSGTDSIGICACIVQGFCRKEEPF